MLISDRPTVQVEINIDAPRQLVWALVTDPARMGEFSPENLGGAWDDPWTGQELHAQFTSKNHWGDNERTTTSTVVQCAEGRVFSFVVGDPRNPSAIWRYQFHPTKGGGTRLVESFEFGSGPSGTSARIAEVPDKEEYVVAARTAEHSQNMLGTLHAIKAEAEKQV